ncbi:MAG: AraC family transcriptional regulator [Thalassobaculum sp.]|uniref:AraC family transcriptional regulator n=1 Tax=Thalassobaculum sp. TaxID=2022740 RepID=UPI0032EB43C3
MIRYDRLSALIARFEMRVSDAEPGTGNLRILGDAVTGAPTRIALGLRGPGPDGRPGEAVLVEASASWGGDSNPLVAALPASVSLPVAADDTDDDTAALVRFLLAEARAARCGSGVVLSRLAEVLVVRLLRAEIERGATAPGLVAGLSDPRLSRAIVALHEDPGRAWSNGDLAVVAGMSLSRFADAFRARVGETPMAYLRRWRMTLARQDLDRGHRVQAVARRYGYGSSEALARAFQRQHGVNPLAVRRGGGVAAA